MIDLKKKRICVTGGKGFLGRHLMMRLKERGCKDIIGADIDRYDLRKHEDISRMYDEIRPHIVIHLAAKVGGIGANREKPGEFFYDNLMMGIQLMEIGRQKKIDKFVALEQSVVTLSSRQYHSRKMISGMVILRKRMHHMVLLRRCFWFNLRRIAPSMVFIQSF